MNVNGDVIREFIQWLPEDYVSAAIDAFDGSGDKAWDWDSSMRDFKAKLMEALEEYQRIADKRASRNKDLLDSAWGIIANAHGGDWDQATAEWRWAAARWRNKLFAVGGE